MAASEDDDFYPHRLRSSTGVPSIHRSDDATDVGVEVHRLDGTIVPTSTERVASLGTFTAQAGAVADESPAGIAGTFREVVLRYSDYRGIARYESRLHWRPAVEGEATMTTHTPVRDEQRIR